MSAFGSSQNYVWEKEKVLGAGTMGVVYKGANSTTGELVAVKVFNAYGELYLHRTSRREIEVLKKVKHENIVKLLAVETDYEAAITVIVMELCSGGSLLSILLDAENRYGLSEGEFLLVLEHLTAGLMYLRDNKLVHRDLKPGNIMKFIADDGQISYKLADFGAARVLEDDETFATLVGTEEYLHPDLFGRAVLRKSIKRTFSANVDLWSVGVTLYHVATGCLPFRSFGERRDRETMHRIINKKESGVISGWQLSENGPIEWSTSLPALCQLSEGLKPLVEKLLAGLFETTVGKAWSYDQYFQEVATLLSNKIVHLFFVNGTCSLEVFLESSNKIDDLRQHIERQTKVPVEAQILLYNKENLEKVVSQRLIATEFPTTTAQNPIFVYSNVDNNVQMAEQVQLPKFPVFASNVSIQSDARLAKDACAVGYFYKRRVDAHAAVFDLVKNAVAHFNHKLTSRIAVLYKKCKEFSMQLQTISANLLFQLLSKSDEKMSLFISFTDLEKKSQTLIACIIEVHKKYIADDELKSKWCAALRSCKSPSDTRAGIKANTFVCALRESHKYLAKESSKHVTEFSEQQLYALEKIKINRNSERIKELLSGEVVPAVHSMVAFLNDWFKLAQVVNLRTRILAKDLHDCHRKLLLLQTTSNALMVKEKQSLVREMAAQREELEKTLNENNELLSKFEALSA